MESRVPSNERSATSRNGARRSGASKGKAAAGTNKKRDGETRRGRGFTDVPAAAAIAVEPEARHRRPSTTKARKNLIAALRAANDGDFSVAILSDGTADMDEIARLFNSVMIKQHRMVDDLVRVSRSVGRDGKMRERLPTEGLSGELAMAMESVNTMIADLVQPTFEVSRVIKAVAEGDLSEKVELEIEGKDVQGEFFRIGSTVNRMVDQLNAFASEVTRVAREVGTEGVLGGQAHVPEVGGTWKDLTDSVNAMARNLTNQVRNIALVTTAVANGDLSRKITVEARGEVLELKDTINTMVDQLSGFAAEVTRVAREVGTEGMLGGQANVPSVAGTWKSLTDNVNAMANNLTNQVRNIAAVTTAVANGDLSQKIDVEARGEVLDLKDTINNMVEKLRIFANEVIRVAIEVGTEGRLGGQATVPDVGGTWKDLTENVNAMAGNLTVQVRNIADVTTAVARGDLSRKITVDVRGEILALKNTVNAMVDQLNAFAGEVTRVAREVGTEGNLGGQAKVPGAAGVWRDLTDNVNGLAANLTSQVRNIADVTTAVANGDLSQKITVEALGEVLSLKQTINNMVDRLRVFGDEVIRVAKEVGTEGKLGGQAEVPNISGTWKMLTESVNAMANSLTVQVRNIADVTTAVTKGDLTRQITVNARGELDELKQNMNQMISNLRETTERNREQDWLKTNLATFTQMLQGQKDLESVSRLIMNELTPLVSAHYGAFFIADLDGEETTVSLIASYAYDTRRQTKTRFALGEGLVGQAALEKKQILVQDVPDDYIAISSGLGSAPPRNIVILPILFEGDVKAVIELASFLPFGDIHRAFLDQLSVSLGVVLNMIQTSMRTEELLVQSQKLTQELQSSSSELQQQNREVEASRIALEEKAEQLSVSSSYKSEFLANMSHELRTPLNALLILAKLLSENKEGTLSPKQVEFAQTIYASGTDLLTLINDILDLSKVEAGKMELEWQDVDAPDVCDFMERTFVPSAEQKGLTFSARVAPDAPRRFRTDRQRLEQILKNLVSNAIKFTEQGEVTLEIRRARDGDQFTMPSLVSAGTTGVMAFAVRDTGIGIPEDKQHLIFEEFQQVDGTTSRKYGGTGLGLSISRAIARLLGGEIVLESAPGRGSTFTLYLPIRPPAAEPSREPTPGAPAPVPSVAAPQLPPARVGERSTVTEPVTGKGHGKGVILVVAADESERERVAQALRSGDVELSFVSNVEDALVEAGRVRPDSIVLALGSRGGPDRFSLLERLGSEAATANVPVVIHSTAERTPEDERRMRQFSDTMTVREVKSLDRIADAVGPFVRPRAPGAGAQPGFLRGDGSLVGKHILIVDDDVRNIFSLTSVLEDAGVDVSFAENGRDALTLLDATPDIDLVLMDVMMPQMDGYETMRAIRQRADFGTLPIIALTAKAMEGDREKSIEAGASDYIPKPVDPDRLVSVVASWLRR
jgi:signal transduction histidine kinase/HAMP domain-containing protein/CheY-like chemotaxis protein